jgi:hypothetical protein
MFTGPYHRGKVERIETTEDRETFEWAGAEAVYVPG